MKLCETKINIGGMLRCCIATIQELDPEQEFENGLELDCKYEKSGNKSMVLDSGVWKWNDIENDRFTN